jgi:ribosomal 50S subunit-recycling heat shock protein
MSTRVDAYIWAIRLTKTRSAAGAACRGGHVRVNGVTAKPAQPIVPGDEIRVRLSGRERIVEVTKTISKRVSAPMAAECFVDRSPPPPPKEILASQPRRDRGAGRPTKRERRQLDRLRDGSLLVVVLAAVALFVGACSPDEPSTDPNRPNTPEAPAQAGSGPFFGKCGGVSLEDVVRITGFGGLTETVNNTSVCEWDTTGSRTGAVASFNWYRGSPIGREEANVKLSRDVTENIEIDGHRGFIGYTQTGQICEIGIGFGADFFEWSIRGDAATPRPIQEICDAARELATLSIERAS